MNPFGMDGCLWQGMNSFGIGDECLTAWMIRINAQGHG